MVDINKLIYWLNRTCKSLDDRYDINRGGCCYVAYVIAKLLDKYQVKDYYLGLISDQEKYVEALEYNTRFHIKKDFPNNLMIKEGTCNHYFIILNNKRINGCMYYWGNKKVHNIKLSIKPKDILWVYRNGTWCDDYDKKYNLRIYNELESVFKKCEN